MKRILGRHRDARVDHGADHNAESDGKVDLRIPNGTSQPMRAQFGTVHVAQCSAI